MPFNSYLFFWIVFIRTSSGKLSILLHGKDIDTLQNDNTVTIIEGQSLLLDCTHAIENKTTIWSRNHTQITRNTRLELERIRFEDEGYYTCTILSDENTVLEYSSVFLKVLYPPSYPVLKVPPSFLFNEEVSFTYLLKAEPEPTYQWRRHTQDGLLLSRNRTYRMTIPMFTLKIYCNFQNLMTPTFGEPITAFVSRYIYINVHIKAAITSIYPSGYIQKTEGDDINIQCKVIGAPTPKVWWTKLDDESFKWLGHRYLKNNINTKSAGRYVCHVENTVVSANGTQHVIYETEEMSVWVIRKDSNDQLPIAKCTDCFEQCGSGADSSSQSSTVTATSLPCSIPSPDVTTNSTLFESTNCSTEHHLNRTIEMSKEQDTIVLTLVVATMLGWLFSVIMIGLNIYICKFNNKIKSDEVSISGVTTENNISNQNSDERSIYVSNVRFTDNTYTDVTTYDLINSSSGANDNSLTQWNDSESVSTQTSVVTYMEPVTTLPYQ